MNEEKSEEISIYGLLAKNTEMALQTFKIMLLLKQNTEEFYAMVRRDFQKRLRIHYFEDDGVGELKYAIKYKHWYYIPYYFIFRDRKRILSENAIIVAEEYLFKLTGRKIKKGHTDFINS